MLTVLGGLAEFERELIRERTSEGRKLGIWRMVSASAASPNSRHTNAPRLCNGAGEVGRWQ
jgi:hypothetical protein